MSTPYPQQPAGQPAVPAQPVQLAPQGSPQGSPQGVPQVGVPYSLAPQRQVPEKISCLLYTSPSPRDPKTSRMPSSA